MASILPDHARDWPLWARTLQGLIRAYCRLMFHLRSGPSRVPDSGPAILVANHHSGPDPLFLVATNRRLISFMIASEYYQAWALRWLYERAGCVPVHRGRPTVSSLRGMLDRLEAGRVVGMFPEGGIHRPGQRIRAKPGAALMALETGAPVIPARISGLRQLPGSDLWTFLRPRRARLRYGSPVALDDLRARYSSESGPRLLQEAADRILEAVYALPE